MLNNQSLNFEADESLHISNPIYNPIDNFNPIKANGYHNAQPLNSPKYVNILQPNQTSGKLVVSPFFQNYMKIDASNTNIVNVSFLGPKKIGKSFLIDNILSLESGQVRRMLSKNNNEMLNMPSLVSYTTQGDRIIYLDNNGEPTPSMFMWLYFLSSVMVYNLSPSNYNEEAELLKCLAFVHNNLQPQHDDQIRPQLVLVRRDTGRKEVFDIELVRKIEQFDLFEPEIVVLHMPYPGTKDVMAKQLLDVPVRQLDPNFLHQVSRLHQIIKPAKPKKINGNHINSLNFRLAIQPLTKSINNEQNLSTKRIWNQVNEDLSINFYNQYLTSYSEELQRQFANEQPYDKYSIYKKLNKIKKRANKKMQKYYTVSDDPIFRKYQQKLNEMIKNKEMLVKSVNQAKSRQAHQENYNHLFEKANPTNYDQLIDLYCKTKLDDQKTEVLLQNFEKVMKKKVGTNIPIPVAPVNPVRVSRKKQSEEIVAINNQLRQVERILVQKSKVVYNVTSPNVDIFKTTVSNKRARLEALRLQYENLANQPQFILGEQNKNEELMELESQRVQLNNRLNEFDKEMETLRRQKESNMKESVMKLQQELKQQQNQIASLQNKNSQPAVYRSKINEAGKSTKKTCCNIM